MKIYRLKLRISNAYVLVDRRPILIDTGTPADARAIRSELRKLGIELSDLGLIVHTHVHSDHVGSTAELSAAARCPIAYHAGDQAAMDRGTNGPLKGVGLIGKLAGRFFENVKFEKVKADVCLADGMRLNEFGCDAVILETPGHTPGSISIITADGDGIIGDVIMGGSLGGVLFPRRPNYHLFAEDLDQALASLDTILARTSRTLYVGHGGPLDHATTQSWRQLRKAATIG